MNFKFYNLHITQESKVAWERGEIKNPRFSLRGIEEQDLSIDEVEELMIESIRESFSDLRNVLSMNEFNEAKIVMPCLQMCSVDNLDVIDFGVAIINPPDGEEPSEEYIEEESLSDWNHPSEMWEEFAEMMADEDGEDEDDYQEEEEVDDDTDEDDIDDDGFDVSEDELNIIKKSINGEENS